MTSWQLTHDHVGSTKDWCFENSKESGMDAMNVAIKSITQSSIVVRCGDVLDHGVIVVTFRTTPEHLVICPITYIIIVKHFSGRPVRLTPSAAPIGEVV
jgi:hypothetical protein